MPWFGGCSVEGLSLSPFYLACSLGKKIKIAHVLCISECFCLGPNRSALEHLSTPGVRNCRSFPLATQKTLDHLWALLLRLDQAQSEACSWKNCASGTVGSTSECCYLDLILSMQECSAVLSLFPQILCWRKKTKQQQTSLYLATKECWTAIVCGSIDH